METNPGYRVGDAGHTIFGPKTFNPSPEIIVTNIKNPELARFIARACNSHYEMLEALKACVYQLDLETLGGEALDKARQAILNATEEK